MVAGDRHPANEAPFVDVSILDPSYRTGGIGNIIARGVVAMVDTGADVCVVDEPLVRRWSLPRRQDDLFDCWLAFEAIGRFASVPVSSRPLLRHGNAFQMLLGWNFLHNWEIRLDKGVGLVELESTPW
jgi:hypothetical protein